MQPLAQGPAEQAGQKPPNMLGFLSDDLYEPVKITTWKQKNEKKANKKDAFLSPRGKVPLAQRNGLCVQEQRYSSKNDVSSQQNIFS